MTLIRVDDMYNAQFQITDFSRFGLVWFGMVTVLSIVCSLTLLLCPFHKKKKKNCEFERRSPSVFVKRIIRDSVSSCIDTYRQLTCRNLEVSEFSFLRKSIKRKSLIIRT